MINRAAGLTRSYSTGRSSSLPLRVIYSSSTDPYHNLAFEGHMMSQLDNTSATSPPQRTLFLWRNEPTVVIGKHQNPYSECNVKYMNEHNVHLVRRHTGGGAVYQDLGNSIFSFLSPKNTTPKENNFDIIKNAMATLGFSVDVSGRNDMTIFVPDLEHGDNNNNNGDDNRVVSEKSGFIPGCDLKISGSAFRATQYSDLHHGTLLVDVDMEQMVKILTPSQLKLASKGIKSVRSRVVNLKNVPTLLERAIERYGEGVLLRKNPQTGKYEETNVSLTRSSFAKEVNHDIICSSLQSSFLNYYNCEEQDAEILQSKDMVDATLAEKINQLRNTEWNYGASPKFTTQFSHKFPFALVDVNVNKTSSMHIDNVSIYTDSLLVEWIPVLELALRGIPFNRDQIMHAAQTAATQQLTSEEERKICIEVSSWICDQLHI